MFVGIDFGTTYSEIAAVDYHKKVELLLDPGCYGIPSVFYYNQQEGECIECIGTEALRSGVTDAENMVLDVKMKLGEKFRLAGREFSSEEIIQKIYKEILKKGISSAGTKAFDNTEIEGAVLSLPNKFTDPERDLLIRSASTCMDKPVPICATIKELVAAAIYYITQNNAVPNEQMKVKEGDSVLVYDLGGGTCDVALVRYNPSVREKFEVIDSDMIRRGGRDWDERVSQELKKQFDKHCADKHRRITDTPALWEDIRKCAVTIKESLKDTEVASDFMGYHFNNMPQRVKFRLSLSEFKELTKDLLDDTMDCLLKMYRNHADQYTITNIICVGGGSKIPQVKEEISNLIPDCKCRLWEPEYAIVKGAAIYADMLGKIDHQELAQECGEDSAEHLPTASRAIVSDIASFSYGVKCYYDPDKYPEYKWIRNIIFKNGKLPVSGDYKFNPTFDDRSFVTFSVYESDSEEDNCELDDPTAKCIGELRVDLPSQYRSVKTVIQTHLVLNEDQILEITATLPDGSAASAKFERTF